MSKKLYLTDIDLNGNKLLNVAIEQLDAAPESPVKGQMYFSNVTNKLNYWNGTEWIEGAEFQIENSAADSEGVQYGLYDSKTGDTFKFRILKTVDSRFKMNMSEGAINFSLDMKYQSALPDELTVPNAVGGITKGTTVESLKAKTIDQVLDDLLFPEIQPTVNAPSASLSFASGFTANGILEVGAAAPQDANFKKVFNRGTVTCPGKPNQNRAGELTPDTSFIYTGGSEANKSLPTKITLGQMQYNYKATYGQGDTLVTSKGKTATVKPNPLPAGSVTSGAVYLFGTYPYFCNGQQSVASKDTNYPAAPTPDTKLNLVKWTETKIYAKFASEAGSGQRVVFKFPSTKRVTKVQVMNDLDGSWSDFADMAVESDAGTMEVQGESVAYKSVTTRGVMHGELHLCFVIANR